MKKMMMFLMLGATVALLAMPVAATNLITNTDETVQDQCTPEAKNALYQEFVKIRKDDQAKAFELAKKYLGCPAAAEVTPEQQKIVDYLKKWSTQYEEGKKKLDFTKALYTDKNYPEAYKLGREILAKDPENLYVLVHVGVNGYIAAQKNKELSAESVDAARKALQALEGGKPFEEWNPLAGKDAALAYLNFTIGTQALEKDPANALKNLIKAAQYETPLKKSPFTYAYIAGAYETGPYAKQSEEYKRVYGGKDETPESKLALANINQLVDRMIDGYARAVSLAGNSPDFTTQKPVWLESLTTWYKYLHKDSTEGMDQLIATITTKPLPPEPTPLTSLPPSTPAATPTGTSGAAPTSGNGTSGTTAPAGTTQPANKTSTTTKPSTTPASASPSKPAGTKPGTTPDRPRNRYRP